MKNHSSVRCAVRLLHVRMRCGVTGGHILENDRIGNTSTRYINDIISYSNDLTADVMCADKHSHNSHRWLFTNVCILVNDRMRVKFAAKHSSPGQP